MIKGWLCKFWEKLSTIKISCSIAFLCIIDVWYVRDKSYVYRKGVSVPILQLLVHIPHLFTIYLYSPLAFCPNTLLISEEIAENDSMVMMLIQANPKDAILLHTTSRMWSKETWDIRNGSWYHDDDGRRCREWHVYMPIMFLSKCLSQTNISSRVSIPSWASFCLLIS